MTRLLYHITTNSGWEGIQRDGKIKRNKDGQVWFCESSALNATIQWAFMNKKCVTTLLATEIERSKALPWMHVPGVFIVEEDVTLFYFIANLQLAPMLAKRVKPFDRWEV